MKRQFGAITAELDRASRSCTLRRGGRAPVTWSEPRIRALLRDPSRHGYRTTAPDLMAALAWAQSALDQNLEANNARHRDYT